MILVTGGAGFIGANFVLDWLATCDEPVLNLDKLTYAGNLHNLASLQGDARHVFVQGDIGDTALVDRLLAQHQPRAVINFAAESHVDRSIHGPEDFIQTNVLGTFRLLEAVRHYWQALPAIKSGVPPVIAPAATPARPAAHRSQCPTQSSAGPAPTWHAPPTGASCPLLPPGRPPCRTSSAGRHRSSEGPNRRPGGAATPTRPGDRARPDSTDRSRCRARLLPAWAALQGAATPRWVSQGVVWTSVADGVERDGNTAHAVAHCAARFIQCPGLAMTPAQRSGPSPQAPKKGPCCEGSRG